MKFHEWLIEKMKNRDGSLTPIGRKSILPRHEPELDYQFFLENASRTMIRVKKPERLIRMIVRIMDEQVKVSHAAMLVCRKDENSFTLIDSRGEAGFKIPVGLIRLTRDNPLIRVFQERYNFTISETGTVGYEELQDILRRSGNAVEDEDFADLVGPALKQMELLNANICIPIYYKRSITGIIVLGKKLSGADFSRQEISFFTTLANDTAMAIANAYLIQDLQEKVLEVHRLYKKEHNIFIKTAISLAAAIDARDPYTHGHTERVTRYSLAMAEELADIPEAKAYKNFKETLHVSALLHDVGKIGVPDSILNKNGPLTKKEYEKVKEHSITGAAILYPIRDLGDIAREVRHHHERYDGGGYPDGLRGEKIPLISRIIAVADTFDAITSDRPYRQKKMAEIAVQIIKDNSGTQFDPIVVSAFLLAYKKCHIEWGQP